MSRYVLDSIPTNFECLRQILINVSRHRWWKVIRRQVKHVTTKNSQKILLDFLLVAWNSTKNSTPFISHDSLLQRCKGQSHIIIWKWYLISISIQSNHALWEYCEKDFQTYDCKKGETEHGKTSHLILCLNQAIASGKCSILQSTSFLNLNNVHFAASRKYFSI